MIKVFLLALFACTSLFASSQDFEGAVEQGLEQGLELQFKNTLSAKNIYSMKNIDETMEFLRENPSYVNTENAQGKTIYSWPARWEI